MIEQQSLKEVHPFLVLFFDEGLIELPCEFHQRDGGEQVGFEKHSSSAMAFRQTEFDHC